MRKDTSGKFVLTLLIFGFVASVVLLVGFKIYQAVVAKRPAPLVAAGGELALDKEDFAAFERGSDATGVPAAQGEATPVGKGVLARPLKIAIAARGSLAPGVVAAARTEAGKVGDGMPAIEWVRLENRLARYEALDRGEVDLVWDTLDSVATQVVRLDALKSKARVVLFLGFSRGADGVLARAPSADFSVLRRQTLAVPMNAPSHFFSLFLLGNSGLTPVEKGAFVSRTYLTGDAAQAVGLWEEERVTAVGGETALLPVPPDAEAVVRWDTTLAPRLVSEVLVANPKLIEEAPRTLELLARGWLEGGAAVAEDPLGARAALAEGLELSPQLAARLLDEVALADAAAQVQFFGAEGGPASEGAAHLDAAQGIWKKLGTVTRTVPGKDWLDGRFAVAGARTVADLPMPEAFRTRTTLKSRNLYGKRVELTLTVDGMRLTAGAERTLSSLAASLTTFSESRLGVVGLDAPEGSRPRRLADAVARELANTHRVPRSRLAALPVPAEGTPAAPAAADAGGASLDGGAGDAGLAQFVPAARPGVIVELMGR